MKKLQILAAFAAIVLTSSAANQFSMSPNDTVRIHPNRLDGYSQQVISMETDGYCDTWNISMTYPQGMMVKLVSGITPMTGMCVDYMNAQGEWQTYEPQLQVSAAYANISATTSALFGYFDYGADMNGDGIVNITDVTMLINKINND